MKRRPEILAPAGDRPALEAAVAAGADAVYFGLSSFSARARATNIADDQLVETLAYLHRHGVKGYVALNTLIFDRELAAVEAAIRRCADAGVDALIVQDLGVARLARAVAPQIALHASTQMTCTDAGGVELARSLGASRVILARELSLDDIAAIVRDTEMNASERRRVPRRSSIAGGSGHFQGPELEIELEVFVHGALCIAYSGQCLTSEAIGGRSANRGACAQACRLPYDLVVDGQQRPLGDRAYLLSPEDLEAAALVPRLLELGIASLKIEGRLKGPEYVAATTRLYQDAVSAALGEPDAADESQRQQRRQLALQMYSRGSGPGFLGGIDHQRLVDGRTCEHRGLQVGSVRAVREQRGRRYLVAQLTESVSRGDGLVVAGGREGQGEVGGRLWGILERGREVAQGRAGSEVWLWLGPDVTVPLQPEPTRERVKSGPGKVIDKPLHRTSAPAATRQVQTELQTVRTVALDLTLRGHLGAPLTIEAISAREQRAQVSTDLPLTPASADGGMLTEQIARAQLGRLGGSPFHLRRLRLDLPVGAGLPLSALNRARRALVAQLTQAPSAGRAPGPASPGPDQTSPVSLIQAAAPPADRAPPPPGLFLLCRNLPQAQSALAAGADGVYLDILELTGTGAAFRALTAEGSGHSRGQPFVGVAPPRIRKPGEEKIDRYLRGLGPAALLVRGLGALHDLPAVRAGEAASPAGDAARPGRWLAVGDFSLNVTNRLTAAEVLARGLDVFTPAFDLDAGQLRELLQGAFAPWAEVVLHHPMPLFHMEHCLFAALLSNGHDHRDCGRPCERHQVSLRDRAGLDHPVEADVGCRNTVFHAAPQSAAELVPALQQQGVRRFRIELVRETPAQVSRLVEAYRGLLAGTQAPATVWRQLRGAPARGPAGPMIGSGYGSGSGNASGSGSGSASGNGGTVVRGSLRVLD